MLDVPHSTRGRCRVLDRTTPSPYTGPEYRTTSWRHVLGIRMRYIRQEMGVQLDFGDHCCLWDVGSEQSQLCRSWVFRRLVELWSRRQPTSRYVLTILRRDPADD
jgi:hypothetical protein